MNLKKTALLAMIALFAASTLPTHSAVAGSKNEAPELGVKLDLSKGVPSRLDFSRAAIPPSVDGEYQIKMIGSKFAAVFTKDGQPVAIFDLTLNTLSKVEIYLGALGFGNMNAGALVKLVRNALKHKKQANDPDSSADDSSLDEDFSVDAPADQLQDVTNDPAKAMELGKKFFKDLRFTKDWADRNGVQGADEKTGVAFQPKTFRLSDVQMPSAEAKEAFEKPFAHLGKVLYGKEMQGEELTSFIHEFEFRFDEKMPGYNVFWRRDERAAGDKEPALPGVVANFVNPYDNLIYKAQLNGNDSYVQWIAKQFGVIGMLVDLVYSQMVHGLCERLDYHERQLMALMESTERFEYTSSLPVPFVDVTTDLLYLNYLTSVRDPNVTNGPFKRKMLLGDEEKFGKKVLKLLNKRKGNKGYEFDEFGGGKFAVARDAKEWKGIYGLGIKPGFLTQSTTLHVNAKQPGWKVAERYAVEVASFAGREILPNNFQYYIPKINFVIGIQVDPRMWEHLIRGHRVEETLLEGELAGLADEAAAGRLKLPLSAEEAQKVREDLRMTVVNPYEISLKEEPDTITANLKILKQAIAGRKPDSFTSKDLIPFVQ